MKKNEVVVGKTYMVKVSGRVVPVKLDSVSRYGGWVGTNTVTGREVRIHTAAKLRREQGAPVPPPVNKYGEEIFRSSPVCFVCHERVGKNVTFRIDEHNNATCWRCASVPENESLESRSVCAQCGHDMVGPKSACCDSIAITPTLFRWRANWHKLSAPPSTASSQAR